MLIGVLDKMCSSGRFGRRSTVMPYKPFWLQRLPDILAALSCLSTDFVDRADFQTIFHVRRRRAIELMHTFGSHRTLGICTGPSRPSPTPEVS